MCRTISSAKEWVQYGGGIVNALNDIGDVNITSVDIKVNETVAEALFIVQVNNNRQLNRLMRKMTKLKHIDYVERAGR